MLLRSPTLESTALNVRAGTSKFRVKARESRAIGVRRANHRLSSGIVSRLVRKITRGKPISGQALVSGCIGLVGAEMYSHRELAELSIELPKLEKQILNYKTGRETAARILDWLRKVQEFCESNTSTQESNECDSLTDEVMQRAAAILSRSKAAEHLVSLAGGFDVDAELNLAAMVEDLQTASDSDLNRLRDQAQKQVKQFQVQYTEQVNQFMLWCARLARGLEFAAIGCQELGADAKPFQQLVAAISSCRFNGIGQLVSAGLLALQELEALQQALADSEQEARAAKRGLWADDKPVAPWVWRKLPKQEQ